MIVGWHDLVKEHGGSNLPKDVVTFIGVWSDTAFDRVEIEDLTGNDDDEYFGRFYTGTIAAAATITAIASTGGAVPGGAGVFTGFPQSPALGGSVTAFSVWAPLCSKVSTAAAVLQSTSVTLSPI